MPHRAARQETPSVQCGDGGHSPLEYGRERPSYRRLFGRALKPATGVFNSTPLALTPLIGALPKSPNNSFPRPGWMPVAAQRESCSAGRGKGSQPLFRRQVNACPRKVPVQLRCRLDGRPNARGRQRLLVTERVATFVLPGHSRSLIAAVAPLPRTSTPTNIWSLLCAFGHT